MNWTPGPARCRNEKYEARILGEHNGYAIGVVLQKDAAAFWRAVTWTNEGKCSAGEGYDLMPPTITREELAMEQRSRLYDETGRWVEPRIMESLVAHVIEAVKSGRVE